jgi:hypothetical protein
MKKPRLAIIGSGIIAHFHVKAFMAAEFDITHIAAKKNSNRAKSFANDYGIKNFINDPAELLKQHKDWDAILLAIDTDYNYLYLDEIIKIDKPALIEKPVSTDLDFLSRYASNDYKNIRVAYNRRFYYTISKAKTFIDSNKDVSCRMELPENVKYDSKNKYKPILLNSIHGIDLLFYLFGDIKLIKAIFIPNDKGRICILENNKGNKITLIMNWNSPSNFSINLDSNFKRLEVKPFEICSLYQGMEVLEPTNELPLRRYIPKKIDEFSSVPDKNINLKPGFFEQAKEIKGIVNGKNATISASLQDAYKCQRLLNKILYDYNTTQADNK